jgi:hypothetical protein
VTRQTDNGKYKADVCREFSRVNSTAQKILKNRIRIFSEFGGTDRECSDFESLKEVKSIEALLKLFKQD